MQSVGGVKTKMSLDFSNIHEDMEKMTPGVRANESTCFFFSIFTYSNPLDYGSNQSVRECFRYPVCCSPRLLCYISNIYI